MVKFGFEMSERPIFPNGSEGSFPTGNSFRAFTIEDGPFGQGSPEEPGEFNQTSKKRGKDRLLAAFDDEISRQNPDLKGSGKKNDWEPFLNELNEDQRVIVTYIGPYAQRLEINRKNAQRLIEVAALDGKIVVGDLVPDRNRSISGVNPDGSVTAGRRVFFGHKLGLPTEQEEKGEYRQVTSTPEGWRIEVAGQRILEDLAETESKVPLEERFLGRFKKEVRDSLSYILFEDKLSLKTFPARSRFVVTIIQPLIGSTNLINGLQPLDAMAIPLTFATWGAVNLTGRYLVKHDGLSEYPWRRSLRSIYEVIMPPVEIDRYLRGLAFLNLKGRNLIRLAVPKR